MILGINNSVCALQVPDDTKLILQAVKFESSEARTEFEPQVFKDSSALPLRSQKQSGSSKDVNGFSGSQLWSKPDSDKFHQCIDRPSGYKRKYMSST